MLILLALALAPATIHAQANFAGSETFISGLIGDHADGFAVDPAGNVYLCDGFDLQLYESSYSAGGYGALTSILSGFCPYYTTSPLAVDAAGSIYYANGSQVLKVAKTPGGFGSPTVVASALDGPQGIALASNGDVYIADSDRVVKAPWSGGSYGAPVVAISGVGASFVAIDGLGGVYTGAYYGGDVVKTAWNGTSYSTPQTIATGINDLTGIAADSIGNVFVSSDDNQENPVYVAPPGAVVDLFEVAAANGSGVSSPTLYSSPVPLGGGDFYVAQGAASDAQGFVYVLWIGGPRGSFSYNVEKINPKNVQFGSVAVGSSAAQTVTFWITGTETYPPTLAISSLGADPGDFSTSSGVNCVPDVGIPIDLEGYPVACSGIVNFAPAAAGPRSGYALLLSGSPGTEGAQLASAPLLGTGTGLSAQIQVLLSASTFAFPGRTTVTVKLLPGSNPTHAPTGTVRLILDGSALPVTLNLSGAGHGNAATYYDLAGVAAGWHSLYAVYSGDAGNPAGYSASVSFDVLSSPVKLDVSCQNPTLVHGANYKCEVYTGPVAAGVNTSITYKYDNATAVLVPLSGGFGSFSIPAPAIGPHSVTISYAAQGNYAAASPVVESFTVVAP